ncbi:olfactory receptor class A-like protein 4 [Megalops cyprinoides]|uniref:olfactory receptor class A-like protein 4 n=1 Tax=Megalops cyprinoides TaxID=118141 RepID=UPI001864C708|nr:olfactory receptor class A-like protein 4 [Megalops cyprinoides]
MDGDEDSKARTAPRGLVSSTQIALYLILVLLGIVGNGTVIGVVGESVVHEGAGGKGSDVILVNMALSNLMVSLMRNMLLVLADVGVELYITKRWCRLLMCVWVWLRSVNVWSTFFLSAFHFQTLRRVAPTVGYLPGARGLPVPLVLGLSLIWGLNLLYSVPAFIYSTSGGRNSTETLMLVSSTTRPLLGCIWKFPSPYSGLAYATTSMVIHETIPIILMSITSLGSLCMLYAHGRTRTAAHLTQNAPVIRRVPAERRAAKVILALIMLFIVSWGTSVISLNYFNYNRGTSTEFLLVVARFANTAFIALSPIVLAIGHRRLRAVIKSIFTKG